MPTHNARATWEGNPDRGQGTVVLGGGAFDAPFSVGSRLGTSGGTNPEELVAAAHASCFAMTLAIELARAGHAPVHLETAATAHNEPADPLPRIARIELDADVDVPGIDEAELCRCVESAAKNCPISQVLSGVTVVVAARLHCRPVSAPAYHGEARHG